MTAMKVVFPVYDEDGKPRTKEGPKPRTLLLGDGRTIKLYPQTEVSSSTITDEVKEIWAFRRAFNKDLQQLTETFRESFKDLENKTNNKFEKMRTRIDAEETELSKLNERMNRLESALEQIIPFVEEKRKTNAHLDKVLSMIEDELNQ